MHMAHPAATIEYSSGDTHHGTVQSRKVRWSHDGCSMYLTCGAQSVDAPPSCACGRQWPCVTATTVSFVINARTSSAVDRANDCDMVMSTNELPECAVGRSAFELVLVVSTCGKRGRTRRKSTERIVVGTNTSKDVMRPITSRRASESKLTSKSSNW